MGVTMVSGGASSAKSEAPGLQKLLEPIAAELHRVELALGEQVQGFDRGVGHYIQYVLGGVGNGFAPPLHCFPAVRRGESTKGTSRSGSSSNSSM